MASNINALNPVNTSPTVASVRANFAAAKAEIEALQALPSTIPNFIAKTSAYTVAVGDLGNLAIYDSAANADVTIPTDAVLALSGATNNSFEVYQKGNGVPNIVAGAGVTLVKWVGYPTSALGVTQTAHRVGANTWAVK